MSESDGPGRCNRCGEPLDDDAPVERAFSGRWPYQHAQAEDCPALGARSAEGERLARAAEE